MIGNNQGGWVPPNNNVAFNNNQNYINAMNSCLQAVFDTAVGKQIVGPQEGQRVTSFFDNQNNVQIICNELRQRESQGYQVDTQMVADCMYNTLLQGVQASQQCMVGGMNNMTPRPTGQIIQSNAGGLMTSLTNTQGTITSVTPISSGNNVSHNINRTQSNNNGRLVATPQVRTPENTQVAITFIDMKRGGKGELSVIDAKVGQEKIATIYEFDKKGKLAELVKEIEATGNVVNKHHIIKCCTHPTAQLDNFTKEDATAFLAMINELDDPDNAFSDLSNILMYDEVDFNKHAIKQLLVDKFNEICALGALSKYLPDTEVIVDSMEEIISLMSGQPVVGFETLVHVTVSPEFKVAVATAASSAANYITTIKNIKSKDHKSISYEYDRPVIWISAQTEDMINHFYSSNESYVVEANNILHKYMAKYINEYVECDIHISKNSVRKRSVRGMLTDVLLLTK